MEQSSTVPLEAPTGIAREETWLERYFGVRRRGSALRLAGLATFLAGMYIIVVNPATLGSLGSLDPALITFSSA